MDFFYFVTFLYLSFRPLVSSPQNHSYNSLCTTHIRTHFSVCCVARGVWAQLHFHSTVALIINRASTQIEGAKAIPFSAVFEGTNLC